MRRFRFPLEKVLRLRGQELEQARRALGGAMLAERTAAEAVQVARAAVAQRTTELAEAIMAGTTAAAFAAARRYLGFLQSEQRRAESCLAEAQTLVAARRRHLLEARRREKVLEKLKERRMETYTAQSLREQQKDLDEFAHRQGLNDRTTGPDI